MPVGKRKVTPRRPIYWGTVSTIGDPQKGLATAPWNRPDYWDLKPIMKLDPSGLSKVENPPYLVDGINNEPFVKPILSKIEDKITFLAHTNGDLDGGMTNVLAPKDGKRAPVWRGKPGDRADAKPGVPPFLTDFNAIDNQAPVEIKGGNRITDPQGGVGGVVFGGAPEQKPSKGPKKEKDLVKRNKELASRIPENKGRVVAPSRSRSRPGRSGCSAGRVSSYRSSSSRGNTARPLPHTGKGLWVPDDQ